MLHLKTPSFIATAFCITAARCGLDDGKFELITGSMIVDPEGYIVAENKTDSDELIIADIDLDACQYVTRLSLLLRVSLEPLS